MARFLAHSVNVVVLPCRGAIGESGTAKPSFNYKGVVYVNNDGETSLSKDEALEKAIEAGAEEVLDGVDDDDTPALKVFFIHYLLLLLLLFLCLNRLVFGLTWSVTFIPAHFTVCTLHKLDFHYHCAKFCLQDLTHSDRTSVSCEPSFC